MNDQEVTGIVEKEFKHPTHGGTKQYLRIHEPVYTDGKITIARIDRESSDGRIIAYIPVLDEQFYFAIYIDQENKSVDGFDAEPYHRVYFRATHESLSVSELKAMTLLAPTVTWNKGDPQRLGQGTRQFSNFEVLPNPEPDELEDKLNKLLDVLEQDKRGVKKLVTEANGCIQIGMNLHIENVDGIHLSADITKRISDLDLPIDFDLYVGGKPFM